MTPTSAAACKYTVADKPSTPWESLNCSFRYVCIQLTAAYPASPEPAPEAQRDQEGAAREQARQRPVKVNPRDPRALGADPARRRLPQQLRHDGGVGHTRRTEGDECVISCAAPPPIRPSRSGLSQS